MFEAESRDEIIEGMIDRELRDIMFKPLSAVLRILRSKLGLRLLANDYDSSATEIALLRNCMLHNGALVDSRLASASSRYSLGDRIVMTERESHIALTTIRKLAYAIDLASQGVEYKDIDD